MPQVYESMYAMISLSPHDLKYADSDAKLKALIKAKSNQAALALLQEVKKRRAELSQ